MNVDSQSRIYDVGVKVDEKSIVEVEGNRRKSKTVLEFRSILVDGQNKYGHGPNDSTISFGQLTQ